MAREITVDQNVHDLAAFRLAEDAPTKLAKGLRAKHDKRVLSLAQAIQSAIENWCEEDAEEDPRCKGDDDGAEYGHPRDRMDGRE